MNKVSGTNSSPRPMGQKEGIAGPKGQFLSALKDEFFGHLDKKSNIIADRLILIKLCKRIDRQC